MTSRLGTVKPRTFFDSVRYMHEDCSVDLVIDRHFCERSFDFDGFSAYLESDPSTKCVQFGHSCFLSDHSIMSVALPILNRTINKIHLSP